MCYIKVRPFLNEFLKEVSKNFNLYLFSSRNKEYVESVIDRLDLNWFFSNIFTQEDLDITNN